jgi:triosephosphate isomerase
MWCGCFSGIFPSGPATPVRKPIVGGNWKSNSTLKASEKLCDALNAGDWDGSKVDVVLFPVALQVPSVTMWIKPEMKVGLQNCSKTKNGAFTGEISVDMIKDQGIEWVLIGHSERRSLYGEDDKVCGEKLSLAMDAGLKVCYCIGEKLPERESGKTNDVCAEQMKAVIDCKNLKWNDIIIAYEPVWAIGTGKVATPAQAQETQAFIRKYVAKNVSSAVAEALIIQYGGSVSPDNCEDLIKCPDIDGFLVGGASLKPTFVKIIQAASRKYC